ncbi:MAG: 4,5-DOPA dioxygenase extradiol [Bacteroidetes bacterium]|jgi:4,5-DOPA dioxygenase extradiol|nr:4,5-DOPA dioxygenase extradiol [Bacteroidota bacterium]
MNRRDWIKLTATGGIGAFSMSLTDLQQLKTGAPSQRMPSIFIGHGSPMNAIYINTFTQALNQLGNKLEKPNAVLMISAHWLTRGTHVATQTKPKTIYDFGGFPEALYQINYPAPGSPEMAKQTIQSVKSIQVHENHDMGLDHGAWTILKHIWPQADVPVYQLSIDYYKSPEYHFNLAKELRILRNKGVMIMGSGNIVHNLGMANFQDINGPVDTWASEFDTKIKNALDSGNDAALINYQQHGKVAQLAVPTNDHFLPLLYVTGTMNAKEEKKYIFEGFQHGNISMRSFLSA